MTIRKGAVDRTTAPVVAIEEEVEVDSKEKCMKSNEKLIRPMTNGQMLAMTSVMIIAMVIMIKFTIYTMNEVKVTVREFGLAAEESRRKGLSERIIEKCPQLADRARAMLADGRIDVDEGGILKTLVANARTEPNGAAKCAVRIDEPKRVNNQLMIPPYL